MKTRNFNFFTIPIILIVAFLSGNVSARLFDTTLHYKNNNFETIAFHAKSCPKVASASINDKRVILRIDDVQANIWSSISKQMVYDANKRGAQVVLGIIPKGLENDSELLDFLKKNSCNTELALHGWEHNVDGDYDKAEFASLSKEEAERKIDKGLRILEKTTNKKITTFIPPQNKISKESHIALEEKGFEIISSEGDGPYDYDASTYDWIKNEQIEVAQIMDQCQMKFALDQPCVIMLHPQDYATDGKLDLQKYRQYLQLLEKIKQQEISTVTFQEL